MSDVTMMLQAIELAKEAVGMTTPNPPVGCIIVADNKVLGQGYTRPAGGPHAELVALAQATAAGHDVTGATMYVTLEPCCHVGKTPPCTEAIRNAGLGRVVVGTVDPFPPMRGKGIEELREAGIQVDVQVEEEGCRSVARGFLRATLHGLPEVTAKAAVSLDGAIATAAGESQWITGEQARAHGHELRARHDAILVGIGTVLEDNPRLTCRTAGALKSSDPVPVVLDSDLRIPKDAALFSSSKRALVFCRQAAPERDLPCEVVRVASDEHGLDLSAVLQALVGRDHHRVLVEGGGAVHRSFMDARLLDTLHLYLAGVVIPGGKPWVSGAPVERLQEALRLGRPHAAALGDDILLSYDLSGQHVCGDV